VEKLDQDGQLIEQLKAADLISTKGKGLAPLMTVRTSRPYESVLSSAGPTISTFKYGLLHSYNLTKTLQSKGQDFSQPVSVLEVCKPAHAKTVLTANVEISSALPCRINVWQDVANNETVLQTIRPSILIGMYNEPELANVAQEVQGDLFSIMHAMA
jgi:uncharacterized protein (DUF302 family)